MLLRELGEHPKVAQKRLGHSSMTMTMTMTMNASSPVAPSTRRSAVNRFAAHLGKAYHLSERYRRK